MQKVTILGSTGSIGANTLDVVARHPEKYSVFALSAYTQVDKLLKQCVQFRPQYAWVGSKGAATSLREQLKQHRLPVQVLFGTETLCNLAAAAESPVVMAAIVGAAGLRPTLAAVKAGKRVLLANKEALVVGGDLFMAAVAEHNATLLPIDSEHSAVFQSLPEDASTWQERVEKIILTASGGPFRTRSLATLKNVTPKEAVAHPNWSMGRKISVDSATMMNKVLELIEARYLFDMPPQRLSAVIHPQSIIHSMVQYTDSSVVAQLGTPDMRTPIAYGLSWPERMESGSQRMDFSRVLDLQFEPVNPQRFPCMQLAWDALNAPAGSTAVLNAANEVAVQAFLDERIRFDQIHAINADTLSAYLPARSEDIGGLLEIDRKARAVAQARLARLT